MGLDDALIFTRVVEYHSFTQAAQSLGMQKSTVSRRIALLEERLGVRLFEKSRVLHWQRGLLRTERGELRAEWIVPAVEGYAASLPPLGHYQLPVSCA